MVDVVVLLASIASLGGVGYLLVAELRAATSRPPWSAS